MNKFNPLLLLLAVLSFESANAGSLPAWSQNLTPAASVSVELSRYQGLPANYVQNFPSYMKNKMFSEMNSSLQNSLQNQNCQPKINVEFLKSVTSDGANNQAIAQFESQMIHIEVISCLPQVKAGRVAATYMSNEYQRRAFNTVVRSETSGSSICQRTETSGLGASEYCYTNQVLDLGSAVYINSFNEYNRDQIAVPVYFREILSAAIDLPSGTLFYSSVYVRSVDFSGFMRTFARSIIRDSQSKAMDVLAEMSR